MHFCCSRRMALFFCHLVVTLFAASSANLETSTKCLADWKECPTEKSGYYYDNNTDKCVFYNESRTCGPQRHLFPSEEQCNWGCRTDTICKLPLDEGSECGQSGELMYYYDDTKKECDLFFYKGCEGNANRFVSVRECEVICRGQRCDLPIKDDDGICNPKRTTYHFRGKDGASSCVKKTNGCDRSAQNFKKESDCRRVCILRP
ncbi:kunitz-type serine protease inhibitor bitisilin-3-like [Dermacentor silvarum]|uniref:kunitz-type serine protease inhibitor bitisilin-3-like n=1 Tax=Dermacentor silvarum TaxID=543639 RepID=UPI0021010EAF|nr:kunitz-type serine protease inhibitor bitisilin-3-like [Dermacentor silvarum]